MEWPRASPRVPTSFLAAATFPATTTFCPCATVPHIHPRPPQKAPAPCSRVRILHVAQTACWQLGNQTSANSPPFVSVCVWLDTKTLRWRDSRSSSGPWSLCLLHSHSFCSQEDGRGGKSVPHTSDRSPILFCYITNHSNCCLACIWTSSSGTLLFQTLLRAAYMNWVDSLFAGRELSSHSFLSYDIGLLFKSSQVFILSPKQKWLPPHEGRYSSLDYVKVDKDSQRTNIRMYGFWSAAEAECITADMKRSWLSALKWRNVPVKEEKSPS